jgi:hypothetical protein
MSLFQIIYVSQPFGFDEVALYGILMDARRNNLRNDVTGALICRADAYLQLIEGPEVAIRGTYARIASDSRHANVNFLFGEPVTDRLFPGWAMRNDPARSWMWTQAEVAAGAIARATRTELLDVFVRLRAAAP